MVWRASAREKGISVSRPARTPERPTAAHGAVVEAVAPAHTIPIPESGTGDVRQRAGRGTALETIQARPRKFVATREAIGYGPTHDARAQRPSMTEREIADRLHGLCLLADRLRSPSHRHTAEDYIADRDEIRDQARRFYKDLTGSWPGHGASSGPERRARPPAPSAVLRHQERLRAAKPA